MSSPTNDTEPLESKRSEPTSPTEPELDGSVFDDIDTINARLGESIRHQIGIVASMNDALGRANSMLDWQLRKAHESGWTYKRIADDTGLTVKDVGTRIARSRKA